MIQVENIFEETFKDFTSIDGNKPLFFHYGNQKEFDSVISVRREGQNYTYPLFWYIMPNGSDTNEFEAGYSEGTFDFFLAHNTNYDWHNDQRFKKVFNTVLQPNIDLVVEKINRSTSITNKKLSNGAIFSYKNLPDYGNVTSFEGHDEAKFIDYVDVVRIKFNLRITDYKNNNCFKKDKK